MCLRHCDVTVTHLQRKNMSCVVCRWLCAPINRDLARNEHEHNSSSLNFASEKGKRPVPQWHMPACEVHARAKSDRPACPETSADHRKKQQCQGCATRAAVTRPSSIPCPFFELDCATSPQCVKTPSSDVRSVSIQGYWCSGRICPGQPGLEPAARPGIEPAARGASGLTGSGYDMP